MFRPGADLGPLLKVLADNDPAALRLRAPALIVQGDDDPIVTRSSTDRVARSLHAGGTALAYHRYPGIGHFDLIAAAHARSARWIAVRLAERPSRQSSGDR
jgi:pimeloyl-ACP methyl ester carboxylesterase